MEWETSSDPTGPDPLYLTYNVGPRYGVRDLIMAQEDMRTRRAFRFYPVRSVASQSQYCSWKWTIRLDDSGGRFMDLETFCIPLSLTHCISLAVKFLKMELGP